MNTGMKAMSATTWVMITKVSTDPTEWPYSAPISVPPAIHARP
jgi:hypothetical protein